MLNIKGERIYMKNKLPLKADHVGSFLRTGPIKQAKAAYVAGKIQSGSKRNRG